MLSVIFLDETLQAIELMTEAFQKYEDVVVKRTKSKDQLLLSGLNVNVNSSAPSSSNAIDELQEIFTKQAALSTASNTLNTLPLEPQKMVIDSAIANNGDYISGFNKKTIESFIYFSFSPRYFTYGRNRF